MASLIESLTQSFTPDLLGLVGKATGLDGTQISKGLGIVGPLVTGALANRASTPDGLSGLMNSLSQAGGGAATTSLSSLITGGGASSSMLSSLIGPGLGAMSGTIDRALGFKVSPLIAMVAPLIIGQLSQRASTQKLDKDGIARLLRDEQSVVMKQGGEAMTVVQQALDAGRDAADTKAKYSADQWSDVRLGAAAVAVLVMGASPSGLVGASKEVVALGKALAESRIDAGPTSILNLACESDPGIEDYKKLPEDGPGLVDVARRALQAVATKSPADAVRYGKMLVDAATRVAEASKEGGFLGIGGTRVSGQEQQAIDEIRAAVRQVVQVA